MPARRALAPSLVLVALLVAAPAAVQADPFALRLRGHGSGDVDRVKIPIDAPAVPADVGAGDFTVELWMKALDAENGAGRCVAGNDGWINGNIVVDRDVFGAGDYGDFGIALFADGVGFGVADGAGGGGLCGGTAVDDGAWHHVAVTRDGTTGTLRLFVDGQPDGSAPGPTGDVSYRDGRTPTAPNDPFLVFGAEKHDAGSAYPSFSGWIDEVRVSTVVRYTGAFAPPTAPFAPDGDTAALYHFDEGPAGPCTGTVLDAVGSSPGACSHGGSPPAGPTYVTDVPPIGTATCGNGSVEPGEECDDGDLDPGDGCEPDCRVTPTDLLRTGRSLSVRDKAGDPTRRKVVVQSRDPALTAPAPGTPGDPSLHGAAITLGRGGAEVDTWALPAAGWSGLGSPPGSQGWRYADKARAFGPCKNARLQPGRQLKATCQGAQIAFTLDEPSQGALAVRFAPGTSGLRTCLAFGGLVKKDAPAAPGGTGQFVARDAAAPPACPLP